MKKKKKQALEKDTQYPPFHVNSQVLERVYVLVFPYICIEWVTSVYEGRRLFTEHLFIFLKFQNHMNIFKYQKSISQVWRIDWEAKIHMRTVRMI